MLTLSRRLRAARVSTGFHDPDDFAVAADINSKRYRRIEEGSTEPIAEELRNIANLTGLSLDFLINGKRTA